MAYLQSSLSEKTDENIKPLIKCIEVLLGINQSKKDFETTTSSTTQITDQNSHNFNNGNGNITGTSTSTSNVSNCSNKLGNDSQKLQWKSGGLTEIFTSLGYLVGDKDACRNSLVEALFPSSHKRNCNGHLASELNGGVPSPSSKFNFKCPRQRRFSPPRPLGNGTPAQGMNLDEHELKLEPASSSASSNDIILNDFCKRISKGGMATKQFTVNIPGWSGKNSEQTAENGQVFDRLKEGALPGSSFKTAYDQLIMDDKAKGIKRPRLPPPGTSSNVHVSGLRKMPRLDNNENSDARMPQKMSKTDSDETCNNPEVQELMNDERIKNVEAKMIEAILNEIIEVDTNTQWSDIAGLAGPKAIIREVIIWPLQRPDIFTGLRGPPKGILLFGPPGTGKTLIGRLIATQSKSTFFNISASSLTSKWIGDGEKMVRGLFQVARVKQPAVIFIDEIDSILTQRSDTEHESSRRLKTEFLIQFDGCATLSEDRILVIGVTNRPQELDEAARRRLVKRVYIPLPDVEARKHLVQNVLKDQSTSLSEDDFDKIAEMTDGYSGADMSALVREAAYGPIRDVGNDIETISVDSVRPIQLKDFELALKHVKASVATKDLSLYEEWDKQFGCHV